MSTPMKKTRIKGIPPFIQMEENDNATKSIYSTSFNDRNTVIFGVNQSLNAGMNVGSENTLLDNTEYQTDISYSGSLKKGVADGVIQYKDSENLTEITPFRDHYNPAADGRSVNDPFFSVGSKISDVGEGFSSPVWAKTKLEIDISSPQPTSHSNFIYQKFTPLNPTEPFLFSLTGSFGPMLYYNFDSERWENVGIPQIMSKDGQYTSSQNSEQLAVDFGMIGFNPGIVNLHMIDSRNLSSSNPSTVLPTSLTLDAKLPEKMFEYHKMAGRYTDQYGFPFATKFHAFSPSTYQVSNLIDRPFALEKVVLVMSGVSYNNAPITSSATNPYDLSSVVAPYTINNFFVLNQRKHVRYSYKAMLHNEVSGATRDKVKYKDNTWTSPGATYNLTPGAEFAIEVDTIRDLIGKASIVGVASNFTGSITRTYGTSGSSLPFKEGSYVDQKFFFRNNASEIGDESAHAIDDLLSPGREHIIFLSQSLSNSLNSLDWSANLSVNFTVSSPVPYRNTFAFSDPFATYESKSLDTMFEDTRVTSITNDNGGRNGLGATSPTGRDFVNSYAEPIVNANDLVVYAKEDNYACKTHYSQIDGSSFMKPNPYILMPGDELVFGWQLPIPKSIAGSPINPNGSPEWIDSFISTGSIGDTWGSYASATTAFTASLPLNGAPGSVLASNVLELNSISFNGPAKVILYGSYIEDGKESMSISEMELETNAVSVIIKGSNNNSHE